MACWRTNGRAAGTSPCRAVLACDVCIHGKALERRRESVADQTPRRKVQRFYETTATVLTKEAKRRHTQTRRRGTTRCVNDLKDTLEAEAPLPGENSDERVPPETAAAAEWMSRSESLWPKPQCDEAWRRPGDSVTTPFHKYYIWQMHQHQRIRTEPKTAPPLLGECYFNLNEPRTALRKHKVGDWNFQVLQSLRRGQRQAATAGLPGSKLVLRLAMRALRTIPSTVNAPKR